MNPTGITPADVNPLDLAALELAAGKPDEVDHELLPYFDEEAKAVLQAIEAELRVWDSGDQAGDALKKLRLHFHALRGAANAVGHLRIGALANGMEELCREFDPAHASAVRGQMIKACLTVLQVIRALAAEPHQPQIGTAKAEQVIRASQSITALRASGAELKVAS